MVSKPPNNARPCVARAPHHVALTMTLGVQEGEFVTLLSHIKKMKSSPHKVGVVYKYSHEY
jgi:hypothetical protein